MAKYIAVSNIDHNGDITEAGAEVKESTFGSAWEALVAAGAVAEVKVTVTEAKTDEENESLKAKVEELEKLLAEAKTKSSTTPPTGK